MDYINVNIEKILLSVLEYLEWSLSEHKSKIISELENRNNNYNKSILDKNINDVLDIEFISKIVFLLPMWNKEVRDFIISF